MVSAIYPAEVIEVGGCRPGFLQLGEGENMVCIDPNDPWGGGGDGGNGSSGGGSSGGGGGGGGTPPKPTPKPHPKPTPKPSPTPKTPSHACTTNDFGGNVDFVINAVSDCIEFMGTSNVYLWCFPNRQAMCCARKLGGRTCVDLSKVLKHRDENVTSP